MFGLCFTCATSDVNVSDFKEPGGFSNEQFMIGPTGQDEGCGGGWGVGFPIGQ